MRLIYTGLSIGLLINASVHAAQSQPSTQTTPAGQGAAVPVITVTGCLQSGAAVPGAAGDAVQFVLTKVVARADAKEPSPNPIGAAGRDTAGAAVGTAGTKPVSHYVVHGRENELAKYAGQRVEIVGTASVSPPVAAGAPDTQVIPHEPQHGPVSTVATPDSAAQSGTAHPSVQHLSVQSLRMVAASCQ